MSTGFSDTITAANTAGAPSSRARYIGTKSSPWFNRPATATCVNRHPEIHTARTQYAQAARIVVANTNLHTSTAMGAIAETASALTG